MSEAVTVYRRHGERPARDYETDAWTRRIRSATTGLMALGVVAGLVAFPFLPEVVPVHFGVTGEADGWGPRWSLLGMLALWAAMQIGLDVVSRHPRVMNFPTVLNERTVQAVYREGERMIVLVAAASSLCFAGGVAMVLGLPGLALTIAGLVLVFVAMIVGVVRIGNAS